MRAGAIIVIVLVVIGVALPAIYLLRRGATTEAHRAAPVLTIEEQFFVQKAYDKIQSAMTLNQDALDKSSSESVRDFARENLSEQQRRLAALKATVEALDPDYDFRQAESVESRKSAPGARFDRNYLEDFIDLHEQALAMLDHASSLREDPSLVQFADQWRMAMNRHLTEARKLLNGLPNARHVAP
jgi:predicted outer membrane protein